MSDEFGTCDSCTIPHANFGEERCPNWKPLVTTAPKPEASAAPAIVGPQGIGNATGANANTPPQDWKWTAQLSAKDAEIARLAQERDAAVAAAYADVADNLTVQLPTGSATRAMRKAIKERTPKNAAVALELERVRAAIAEAKFWHVDHDCTVFPERDNCRHVAKLQSREKELTEQTAGKTS